MWNSRWVLSIPHWSGQCWEKQGDTSDMTGDPGEPGTETGHLALQGLGFRHDILVCWGKDILSLRKSVTTRHVRGGPGSPQPYSVFAFPRLFLLSLSRQFEGSHLGLLHPGATAHNYAKKCVWRMPHQQSSRVCRGFEPAPYDVYIRGFDLGFLVIHRALPCWSS